LSGSDYANITQIHVRDDSIISVSPYVELENKTSKLVYEDLLV